MSADAARDVSDGLLLRRATDEDRPRIIGLCRASLGWAEGDPNEAFFAWKHDENPFGPSPAWVAEAPDGSLVGLRVFLRWRFLAPDGTGLEAVRAVDTATHPQWQGKGIFTKLTLGAIPDLRGDGIDFVFNTPNDKSRPGYLKMGWSEVGRVPVGVRVAGPRSIPRLAASRTAAELWSEQVDVGAPAADVFSDEAAVERLLAACGSSRAIATDRSAAYLRWRYRFGPLRYRAVLVGRSIEDGVVVLRVRRRGEVREVAICEVLVPGRRRLGPVMSRIARETNADHLLRCTGLAGVRDGFLPAAPLGPILTWRPIRRTGVPAMGDLRLALGDVELF